MTKKYEFTGDSKKYGVFEIHRIRRLSDGQVGGWIEVEENLSHEGNCWVAENAYVFENAQVSGNAQVYEDARVYGSAHIYMNASIYQDAWVSGNALVYRNAKVYGRAHVYGNACISGTACVYGNAYIYENAKVYGNACVYGGASISGNTVVHKNAVVKDIIISYRINIDEGRWENKESLLFINFNSQFVLIDIDTKLCISSHPQEELEQRIKSIVDMYTEKKVKRKQCRWEDITSN